jgi:hypothetical protein
VVATSTGRSLGVVSGVEGFPPEQPAIIKTIESLII